MTREYETSEEAWRAVERARNAISHLRTARDLLSDSPRARVAVRRAMKSAEGASRHAERVYYDRYYEERRQEGTA
jgi:hypothetical protein